MQRKIAVMLSIVVSMFFAPPAFAGTESWQKGATIIPNTSGEFETDGFRQSLRNLKADNANFVTLAIPYGTDNIWSTNIWPQWNKPSDTDIGNAIDYAHSIGLKVNVKIHLYPADGQWSAYIDPSNVQEWFTNYENVALMPMARLAADHGAEQLTIGNELSKMTRNDNPAKTAGWKKMIGNVRGVFKGHVTYNSQHEFPQEFTETDIFYDLDSLGISGYHPLATWTGNPSQQELEASWDEWNKRVVTPAAQKFGKPILFTEVGYRSVDGAHYEPAAYWRQGGYNPDEQSKLYSAMIDYWGKQSNFIGVHLWDWKSDPNAGGPGNTDFTIQNKPAEQIVRAKFAGDSTPPPSDGGGGGGTSTSFMTTATVDPGNPAVGQAVQGTASVKNNGTASASDVTIDVEIYGPNGQVYQKFFEHQSIGAGQTKTFPFAWTPNTAGTYTVQIGVFSGNWSQQFTWNNAAATINAGSDAPPVTPPPSSGPGGVIDVWWVTDGQTVSGLQPFKVLLTQADVGSYTMYWQVDNDVLNPMGTSMQDYPHKESWIDLTGWGWHEDQRYPITFIAKDLSGKEIARKTVTLIIPR